MQVLVVLPVYNEDENLKRIITEILVLDDYLKILVIDDCSLDKSLEIAKSLKKENPERIFIISQLRHSGRGCAVKKGYNFAIDNNFEFLIEMDSDLSHKPEYISFLLREAQDVDMVIGSRLIKGGFIHSRFFLRNIITYISNFHLRFILGLWDIRDVTSGFRCINVEFLRKINLNFLKSKGPQLLQEIIFKNKDNICIKELPIIFEKRYRGKSKFTLLIIFKSLWLPLYWRIENLLSFSF
jgi:dolichol-phosphate mannosyltransferase